MFSEVGAILVSFGAIICIGAILKFTLDILEFQITSKKKVLGIFISNFETYNRYFWVADEKKNS